MGINIFQYLSIIRIRVLLEGFDDFKNLPRLEITTCILGLIYVFLHPFCSILYPINPSYL